MFLIQDYTDHITIKSVFLQAWFRERETTNVPVDEGTSISGISSSTRNLTVGKNPGFLAYTVPLNLEPDTTEKCICPHILRTDNCIFCNVLCNRSDYTKQLIPFLIPV